VHAVLDVPVGVITFIPAVVLLSTSAGLAITFPIAVPFIVLLFLFARLVGRVERRRLAALLGTQLADPVPPIAPGSLWRRFTARLTSMPRWKEIGYCIVRFPTGMAFGLGVTMLWAGSLALAALPATIRLMPDDRAEFWLFTVGDLPTALLVALVGLVGLVFVAPWSTLAVGRLDVAFASWFLGPNRQAQLAAEARTAEAGRAAAVGSAETERRRIERDLHDGAQQRLVALAMDLGAARERLDSDPEIGKRLVAKAHDEAKEALREIRDLVRGIHPVILEDRGLDAALSAIVARSPIPVDLDITIGERPPATVESAAYVVVSEALTNVARHSDATRARVAIARRGDRLLVEVSDDGRGGADPSQGTGLAGLAERAAAMGGTMDVLSPTGGPTTLLVELPCAS
jgi:signal transduction histidine kinase